MSDRFKHLRGVQDTIRSYSEPENDGITDEDEQDGLEHAAHNVAATHSEDELHELVGTFMAPGNDDKDEGEHKSYAADMAGKTLSPTKKNPAVRRWIKTSAVKKIGQDVKHQATWGIGLSSVMHHAMNRHKSLKLSSDSALHASHYLKHHEDFTKTVGKKYGVRKETVAVALAHHAHVEIAKQKKGGLHTASGKLKPFHNNEISDHDFHKNLGGRAKSAMISGMIARHGK